jgi:hypothetical protein
MRSISSGATMPQRACCRKAVAEQVGDQHAVDVDERAGALLGARAARGDGAVAVADEALAHEQAGQVAQAILDVDHVLFGKPLRGDTLGDGRQGRCEGGPRAADGHFRQGLLAFGGAGQRRAQRENRQQNRMSFHVVTLLENIRSAARPLALQPGPELCLVDEPGMCLAPVRGVEQVAARQLAAPGTDRWRSAGAPARRRRTPRCRFARGRSVAAPPGCPPPPRPACRWRRSPKAICGRCETAGPEPAVPSRSGGR